VVVATGGPTRAFQPLARRFTPLVTYRVVTSPLPATDRRQLPPLSVALREATCPGHLLRWTRDRRLLFAGIERARLAERSRPTALVQHTAQLMYELSLLYPHLSGIQPAAVWDAATSVSDDGLPYIGPHRHYPRHLFALGAGRSGGGVALLAARILVRHWQDAPEKADALFGFGR
jgi:glycine/D-amino acid oxidase-like deaminating enzyme